MNMYKIPVFLFFFLHSWNANGEIFILPLQDTSKMLTKIPLYYQEDQYISRYCGEKITRTICDLNSLYKDYGILFSLENHEHTSTAFPVASLFRCEIINSECIIQYDIQAVEFVIQSSLKTMLPEEINTPSKKQIKVKNPSENTVVYYKSAEFSWEKAEDANQYLVEISLDNNFSITWLSTVIFATECRIKDLPKNQMIYWRIKPINYVHYCEEYRASGKLYASDIFVKPFSLHEVSVYSLGPPTENSIFIYNPDNKFYHFQIESLEGKIIQDTETNASQKIISVKDYKQGAYFVYLTIENKRNVSTLQVR